MSQTLSPVSFESWLSGLSDAQVMAVTLLGEARGEDRIGRHMVASVIMNRVAIAKAHQIHIGAPYWWGSDVRSVILKPWQFSCWNANDPNRHQLPSLTTDPLWSEAMTIAATAMAGMLPDQTHGADSYLNPAIVKSAPTWAVPANETARHLHHVFYKTT